jgi:hypothetical protein
LVISSHFNCCEQEWRAGAWCSCLSLFFVKWMIIQDFKWLVPSWEWSVWQLSIVNQQTCAVGEEVKCNSVILSHFVADETGICTQISRKPVPPQVFNTCQSHTNPLSTGYLTIIEDLNTCCWLIGIGQSTLINFYQFQVFKPLGTFALESFLQITDLGCRINTLGTFPLEVIIIIIFIIFFSHLEQYLLDSNYLRL